jgi:hypothetical protein
MEDGVSIDITGLSGRSTLESQTYDLRFMHGRLQQKRNIYDMNGYVCIGVRHEWRDVPDATPARSDDGGEG